MQAQSVAEDANLTKFGVFGAFSPVNVSSGFEPLDYAH